MGITKFSGAINGNYYPIARATYTATTGSPTVDTSSRAGKTIIKYAGSGSITIGVPGYVEILVMGGGGACGMQNTNFEGGGGGGGGVIYSTSAFLPAGTHTVTVGAGGAKNDTAPKNGEGSEVGPYAALGGGTGGPNSNSIGAKSGGNGGCGGGGAAGTSGGSALLSQGYNGGVSGGGGAGGAPSGNTGGAGRSISITGTSVTYGEGGNGSAQGGENSYSANTGHGAAGGTYNGANGASGYVVVVIG